MIPFVQMADDLVVGLRRRAEQEADVHASCLRELHPRIH